MAATDLPTLLDFEGQFEDAAQAMLAASSITAYISQQAVKKVLINTGLAFDTGAAVNELTQLALPPGWPVGQQPPQEYFRFTGNLTVQIEVPRDQNAPTPAPDVGTILRTMRGQLRALMLRVNMPFTDTNLPLLRVTDIRPGGATTGFESARNIDFCTLSFAISFLIKPDSWPAYPWNPSA